jgi:ribulose 1,5-bisphosphate synthetase/thiazole synthase
MLKRAVGGGIWSGAQCLHAIIIARAAALKRIR